MARKKSTVKAAKVDVIAKADKLLNPSTTEWSSYQKAIFNNIENETGHTVILARAGSGKTFSLIESLNYVSKDLKSLMVAFNSSIADELKLRVPNHVEAKTIHSLGFLYIRQAFGNVTLDKDKCFKIVKSFFNDNDFTTILQICKLVSLAKSYLYDTQDKLEDLIDDFTIDLGELSSEEFCNIAIQTLRKCKEDKKTIDYDDMVWFPIVYNLGKPIYDRVFIDELQDVSFCQLSLCMMSCKKSGRIIACGDDYQCLYKFRGADLDGVFKTIKKLNATVLKLPITYRCPKKVVKLAQELVPDIEEYEKNSDGIINNISDEEVISKIKPGDFFISRTNAPLIKFCMSFLKNGIPANILGKDIGSNLSALIGKSRKKTVVSFLEWLEVWKKKELARCAARKKDFSEIQDKYECLIALSENASSLNDIKNNISKLFENTNESTRVTLSTVHKIKGKQANNVFILSSTFRKGKDQSENNIYYTAITRTMKELYFISSKSKVLKNNQPISVKNKTSIFNDFNVEKLNS